jgi:hypothetical protein
MILEPVMEKRLIVFQFGDSRRELPRDDIERRFAIRETVSKVEEVDINEPMCDQTLSCWTERKRGLLTVPFAQQRQGYSRACVQ